MPFLSWKGTFFMPFLPYCPAPETLSINFCDARIKTVYILLINNAKQLINSILAAQIDICNTKMRI